MCLKAASELLSQKQYVPLVFIVLKKTIVKFDRYDHVQIDFPAVRLISSHIICRNLSIIGEGEDFNASCHRMKMSMELVRPNAGTFAIILNEEG
jgi:hypothetical protein